MVKTLLYLLLLLIACTVGVVRGDICETLVAPIWNRGPPIVVETRASVATRMSAFAITRNWTISKIELHIYSLHAIVNGTVKDAWFEPLNRFRYSTWGVGEMASDGSMQLQSRVTVMVVQYTANTCEHKIPLPSNITSLVPVSLFTYLDGQPFASTATHAEVTTHIPFYLLLFQISWLFV
jgi:hypothetical protein